MMEDARRVAGRIALVTGAAEGIGEACARKLAAHGATVILSDINVAKGEVVAKDIGNGARFLALDVADLAAWEATIAIITQEFGGIDILVNNAGGSFAIGPIGGQSLASHQQTLAVNVTGTWSGIRSVEAAMTARGGGSIINISSIDGFMGIRDMSSYVAAKHAVLGLTRALAMELGEKGIRVNSVHPGITATPVVLGTPPATKARLEKALASQPIKRMGQPEDIANAMLFFASDESSYCTGTSLVVDGGHIAGIYREPL